MSEEPKKSITGGGSQRFCDLPLTFGLRRLTDNGGSFGEHVLWRFYVSKWCGGSNALVEVDADPKLLREMKRWIERAIETVETDGNRKYQTNA